MRVHVVAVVVLEVAFLALAFGHHGLWHEHRALLAVAFLLGALAAPWTLLAPFLLSHGLTGATALLIALGAAGNLGLRYLGYRHGLADTREAPAWRSARPHRGPRGD